ncbi:MAG: hypothetical protein GY854_09575 [Deltaproteobacteria bacterium]|nr:hypothetical protein [Deltaproteobacteria bacterium]
MKRTTLVFGVIVVGFCAVACLPDATQEEMEQMCGKLVELRGEVEVVTVTDAVTVVKKEYQKKHLELTEKKAAELKDLGQRREEALAKAADDEEKAKIEKEMTAEKEAIIARYLPQIEELNPQRETAVKDVSKKAQQSKAEWDEAMGECIATSQKEGVKQKVAQCRTDAKNLDQYWNSCR